MGQLRTANKRHNRAIIALHVRKPLAEGELPAQIKPAKVSS